MNGRPPGFAGEAPVHLDVITILSYCFNKTGAVLLVPIRILTTAGWLLWLASSTVEPILAAPPGEVRFSNYAFGILDAPFFDNLGQRLSGTNYLAELYAGVDSDSLFGIGPAARFSTGPTAGYFDGGTVLLPAGVTGGGCGPAWVQVRAWAAAGGTTFEQATLGGYWTGTSSTIYLPYTGGCGAGVPNPPVFLQGLKYPGPPIIVQQPPNRDIMSTDTMQLWVVASGGVTLTYQWYSGLSEDTSAPILGATNAFYQPPTTNVTYWVRASTSAGQADSRTASVWVVPS